MTDLGQDPRKLFFREKIKEKRVKVIEFKGYNSKIVSAEKAERRRLKTRPVLSRFSSYSRPGSDTTL